MEGYQKLNKTVQHQTPLKKADGSWARTDHAKANLFATHLKEVFTPNLAEPLFDNSTEIQKSLDFRFANKKKEILDIIKSLKKNKKFYKNYLQDKSDLFRIS